MEKQAVAEPGEVTLLLGRLSAGERCAIDELLPHVYDALHSVAGKLMRWEAPGHTLQATVLVHEAYLKLVGQTQTDWQDTTHFLRVAAMAMRRILRDHARRKLTEKRGGGWKRVRLDCLLENVEQTLGANLLDLDAAMEELAACDAERAAIVEMRYFGGMATDQVASVLGRSPRTVERRWESARRWLRERLQREARPSPSKA